MKRFLNILIVSFLSAVLFTACSKLEVIEPEAPTKPETRRAPGSEVFEIDSANDTGFNGREGRTDDIGDGPGNVNDDDDSEDGDEIQGAAKRQ